MQKSNVVFVFILIRSRSEKTFVITRSNSEIVEFTAESPAVAREWIAVLKPKVLVVVLEGHLLKKKIRNGKAVSMGKMRWVVLTKDSFKVFEEKGGRKMSQRCWFFFFFFFFFFLTRSMYELL